MLFRTFTAIGSASITGATCDVTPLAQVFNAAQKALGMPISPTEDFIAHNSQGPCPSISALPEKFEELLGHFAPENDFKGLFAFTQVTSQERKYSTRVILSQIEDNARVSVNTNPKILLCYLLLGKSAK